MRVLITGGAGFIGSHLARGCLEAGDAVRVLDDFSTGRPENLAEIAGEIEISEGSVTDPETVRCAVRGCEIIYHHAALVSVPCSIEEPLVSHGVNATGTLNVLEAARLEQVRRVVYASSCAVYGEPERLPATETDEPCPLSPYALQKLIGERYCRLFGHLYGLQTVSLRYFNVYGPRQNPATLYAAVIPLFIQAVAKGDPPRVLGDGKQTRDFVFVKDVVNANRAAAEAGVESSGRIFNVAHGTRISLIELLREICRLSGRDDCVPIFEAARPGDIRHSQADIEQARSRLGWEPEVPLEAGLRETIRFFGQEPAR